MNFNSFFFFLHVKSGSQINSTQIPAKDTTQLPDKNIRIWTSPFGNCGQSRVDIRSRRNCHVSEQLAESFHRIFYNVIICWAGYFRPPNAHEKHISKTLFSYKTFATTIAETSHHRNELSPNRHRPIGVAEMALPKCPRPEEAVTFFPTIPRMHGSQNVQGNHQSCNTRWILRPNDYNSFSWPPADDVKQQVQRKRQKSHIGLMPCPISYEEDSWIAPSRWQPGWAVQRRSAFTTVSIFVAQYVVNHFTNCDQSKLPSILLQVLIQWGDEVFPNIFRLLKMIAALPMTTCEAKRSFSALHGLKMFLRTTTVWMD